MSDPQKDIEEAVRDIKENVGKIPTHLELTEAGLEFWINVSEIYNLWRGRMGFE